MLVSVLVPLLQLKRARNVGSVGWLGGREMKGMRTAHALHYSQTLIVAVIASPASCHKSNLIQPAKKPPLGVGGRVCGLLGKQL